MKKKLFIGLLLTMALSFTTAALAKESIAEQLNLKGEPTQKSVFWSHKAHGTSSKIPLEKQAESGCATCHVPGENKKLLISQKTGKPLDISSIIADGAKNKLHTEFCWECHNVEKVKVGRKCATCHTGPKS